MGTRPPRRRIREAVRGLAGAGLGLVLALSVARAEAQTGPAEEAPPPVGLDTLLKLPSQTVAPSTQPTKGGHTRNEWLTRFAEARSELTEAQERLAAAQQQLGELASGTSAWQVGAPGGGASAENGPLSYGLRQEIRRNREDIARAEQVLEELRIEANLAGVPPEWTGAKPVLSTPQQDAVPAGSRR